MKEYKLYHEFYNLGKNKINDKLIIKIDGIYKALSSFCEDHSKVYIANELNKI